MPDTGCQMADQGAPGRSRSRGRETALTGWLVVAGLCAGLPLTLRAQAPREPRAAYIFPAGGQAGTTFNATIGGQFLDGATNLVVSGTPVDGVVQAHAKPLSQREINALREKLQMLQEVPAPQRDTAEIARLRRVLAEAPRRLANPGLAETVTIQITVPADTPPGVREVRLLTSAGLTSPLRFEIGALPEVQEREPNDRLKPDTAASLAALPVTVNGQLLAGDVDRFAFAARRGQRLVARARARELQPYLADAVPGWCQAVLAVYAADGREIAFADDHRLQPDPVLAFEVPEDGDYVIEIRDALHRGREDFVYRLDLGDLPHVTSVFPLGGPAEKPVEVAFSGWNLPQPHAVLGPTAPGESWVRPEAAAGARAAAPVPFMRGTLPELVVGSPGTAREAAVGVRLPSVLNSRIRRPGERHFYRFTGRQGDEFIAEVTARRLGSPLDAVIVLTDPVGRPIASNDDSEDKGAGLVTHHADPRLAVGLPADGEYRLELRDTAGAGSDAHAYRLRVGPPQPDFTLRVVPSTLNARAGATVPVTVHALRRDGFDGEIPLALRDAPDGFRVDGAAVSAGCDQVRLTLTVPSDLPKGTFALALEGMVRLGDDLVRRPAVPADDRTQAFSYRHLVPAQEWRLAVLGPGRAAPAVRYLSSLPVRVPAGGSAVVRLVQPRRPAGRTFELTADDPPPGISVRSVETSGGGTGIEIRCAADAPPVGTRGNLIVQAASAAAPGAGGRPAAGGTARAPRVTLPALPFEITPAAP